MQRQIVFGAAWDDRKAEIRGDAARIAQIRAESQTQVLPMWRGRPLVTGTPAESAQWVGVAHPVLEQADDDWIYLGMHGGRHRFAADLSQWTPEGVDEAAMAAFFDPVEYHHPACGPEARFAELRGMMLTLDPVDAAMASTARGLMNWHASHRFCSRCGQPSNFAMAGWQRNCPSCKASHFPRTDPVVIMLVHHGDSILLGRSPGWPPGMYSTLAGFVEPGETLESAVRREVFEETGVRVAEVHHVASQPWPWPNSLMMGFAARALSTEITLDHELEDARWLDRDEIRQVLAGEHPVVRRPRGGAIAHELLTRWNAGEI